MSEQYVLLPVHADNAGAMYGQRLLMMYCIPRDPSLWLTCTLYDVLFNKNSRSARFLVAHTASIKGVHERGP